MAKDFADLIRDEYRRDGKRGVLSISLLAFGEVLSVAIRQHFMSNWFISATLSLVITCGVLGSLVGIMTSRPPIFHQTTGIPWVMCR